MESLIIKVRTTEHQCPATSALPLSYNHHSNCPIHVYLSTSCKLINTHLSWMVILHQTGSVKIHPHQAGSVKIHPHQTGSVKIHPHQTGSVKIHPHQAGSVKIHPHQAGSVKIHPHQTGSIKRYTYTKLAPLRDIPIPNWLR